MLQKTEKEVVPVGIASPTSSLTASTEGKSIAAPAVEAVVTEAIRSAEVEINELESKNVEFSKPAYQELRRRISEFIYDLATEAAREARRQNADQISRSHVAKAGEHLVTGSGKKALRHLGNFGTLLIGAGVSQFLSMASMSNPPLWLSIVAALMCMIGAAMWAIQAAKE